MDVIVYRCSCSCEGCRSGRNHCQNGTSCGKAEKI